MASVYDAGNPGEGMDRPVATRRPEYKQTNMAKVLMTIAMIAAVIILIFSVGFLDIF